MQKRRGAGSTGYTSNLPMTIADTANSTNRIPTRRKRIKKGRSYSELFGHPMVAGFALVGVLLLLLAFVSTKFGLTSDHQGINGNAGILSKTRNAIESNNMKLGDNVHSVKLKMQAPPLSRFSSLSFALENANLVALYFAASWCNMSTPVSEALEDAFPPSIAASDSRILFPPGNDGDNTFEQMDGVKKDLAIVYVSSDSSEEEQYHYSRSNWINVPFDSEERSELKRHFKVCAKRELDELDMIRYFEIPTLIIVDSSTQGILTNNAKEDVIEHGSEAIDRWLELRDLVRALEDKYE